MLVKWVPGKTYKLVIIGSMPTDLQWDPQWQTSISLNQSTIQIISFKKMHLNMSSTQRRPFWLGLDEPPWHRIGMDLLPDTYNCGLRMRRECRERFPCHWLQRKPLVRDPGMHHGTCVTHVPWCMSGSLTRGGGENVLDIPVACATRNFAYLVRGPWYKSPVSELLDVEACLILSSENINSVSTTACAAHEAFDENIITFANSPLDIHGDALCRYVRWQCNNVTCASWRSLQWRHHERDGVSKHDCLPNRLFRRISKNTSKLRLTGLCEGIHQWPVNSPHKEPVARKRFPFDDAIMWNHRHHDCLLISMSWLTTYETLKLRIIDPLWGESTGDSNKGQLTQRTKYEGNFCVL